MTTFLEAAGADNESAARERRAALVLAALTLAAARVRRPRPRHLDGATGGRDRLGRRRRVTPAPRGGAQRYGMVWGPWGKTQTRAAGCAARSPRSVSLTSAIGSTWAARSCRSDRPSALTSTRAFA